jgi:predicted transcriptional regulator of viral defense system
MRPKKLLEQLRPLLTKPSFNNEEAETLGVSRRMLNHYVKSGDLEVDFQWEDLVRTLFQIPTGVVCMITALRLWELTDEHSREFWVAIPNSQKPPRLKHVRAVRMRNLDLGRTVLKMGDYEIPIFDPERCVVDAFRYLSIEIAVKALKYLTAKNGLNYQKLSEYSKILRVDITPYVITVST